MHVFGNWLSSKEILNGNQLCEIKQVQDQGQKGWVLEKQDGVTAYIQIEGISSPGMMQPHPWSDNLPIKKNLKFSLSVIITPRDRTQLFDGKNTLRLYGEWGDPNTSRNVSVKTTQTKAQDRAKDRTYSVALIITIANNYLIITLPLHQSFSFFFLTFFFFYYTQITKSKCSDPHRVSSPVSAVGHPGFNQSSKNTSRSSGWHF